METYPIRAALAHLPSGRRGIRATLDLMAELTRQRRVHPRIRLLAEQIIAEVPEKDERAEAAALQVWVRDNVRYTADVYDVETVKDPLITLQTHQGDCDDKSVLYASLAQSVGLPAKFIAVGMDGGDLSHVFPAVEIAGQWHAAETTEPVSFGWFPKNITSYLQVSI